MGHYSAIYDDLRARETADNKRKLHLIIDKANNEDSKYLLKVAQNLKGYKNFEKFISNVMVKGKNLREL